MSNIIKKPLQVICIASKSIKLIKGATYLAVRLYTSYTGEKYVYLKDIGVYKAIYFTTIDDIGLLSHPDFNYQVLQKTVDPKSKDYSGEYVRCKYSYGKNLKEGEIYYVEKQISKEIYSAAYNAGIKNYDYKFKFRGISRPISARYKFEEISVLEQRKIKLQSLQGDKIKTGEQTRKFLLYSEKDKIAILFEILSRVIIDLNKVNDFNNLNLNIPDLMIKKGSKYGLRKEDIEPFLLSKIQNLMNCFKEASKVEY